MDLLCIWVLQVPCQADDLRLEIARARGETTVLRRLADGMAKSMLKQRVWQCFTTMFHFCFKILK